jgi:hypothetical protein
MKIRIIILSVVLALMTTTAIFAQDCSLNGAAPTDNCPTGTIGDDLFIVTGFVNTSIVTDAGADTVNMTGGTINTAGTGHGVYDTNGVTVTGGTITVSAGWDGIWSEGDGDMLNSANINATGDGSVGISESQLGNLVNNGNISTNGLQAQGLLEVDAGDAINNGNISTGGTSSHGIYEIDAGDAINNGNITTTGSLAHGIQEFGDGNVVNGGKILTSGTGANGIRELSTGAVTNDGTIIVTGAGSVGIYEEVDGDVTNNGSVTAATGIAINTAVGVDDDTVTNNGVVTGGIAAIQTGSGNDTVINNGSINGTVNLGTGDDTMIVRGVVTGTMDGGADWDTLIFEMTVEGTSSDLDALAREMAAANPAGGSITINGYTFTWLNFESLINLLNFIVHHPSPRPCAFDGRINAFDCQAPVTLYYHPLQIWGVDPNTGAGTFAFSITPEQIDAAGIPASGTVLIASGTHPVTGLPISLYRHANGAFQINAFFPDMKPYVGIWIEYGGFTNISGEQS